MPASDALPHLIACAGAAGLGILEMSFSRDFSIESRFNRKAAVGSILSKVNGTVCHGSPNKGGNHLLQPQPFLASDGLLQRT
jgi:hypothetical protein